jgi:hypothetical protein
VPNQGGLIWLAILVTVLIAFDYRNPISRRNFDVLLLIAPMFLFIDLIRFATGMDDPTKFSLAGIVFLAIYLVTLVFLVRVLGGAYSREKPWAPNLPASALAGLMILLFLCNTVLVFARPPDDCGTYTNLGAKRMLETGRFPYADPMLRGGAAATYGPLLYVAQMPFQLLLRVVNPSSFHPAPPNFNDPKTYPRPPILTTRLTLLAFHILGIAALFTIGRQLANAAVGWALVCLYIGSTYVQGAGGEMWVVSGMSYISHIAPAAVTLMAFALLARPMWAGAMLGVGAGILFYPAFFFPLWLGYFFWRGKDGVKFTAGFVLVCALVGGSVLLLTQPGENDSRLHAIYESTVAHQESPKAYGSSTFSFWGTHPRLAAILQRPFLPGWYLFKPMFLVFAGFLGLSFFLARGRSVPQFAFLTAAVAIAIQLWKSHAGGTYVEWYLPFFLIGAYAGGHSSAKLSERSDATADAPQDSRRDTSDPKKHSVPI